MKKKPHRHAGLGRQKDIFTRFAQFTAWAAGQPPTFLMAFASVILWALTGPLFEYSETWQLVINTGTTIVTFLMVFLVQNTQNRDTRALHIKLDELIRATEGGHTVLLDLEELSEKDLKAITDKYEAIARKSRELLHKGETDTHVPDIDLE
ncbi:MAG: low affinity iron permease family protein [Alphaproteobacteria bacterium]|nr:low affinity iron permease family protein [Alphaproteobacteria bacterium]